MNPVSQTHHAAQRSSRAVAASKFRDGVFFQHLLVWITPPSHLKQPLLETMDNQVASPDCQYACN
jgi:hypothetical protein